MFGDTTVVHVSSNDAGGYVIDKTIGGDTVMEVLAYVQFTRDVIQCADAGADRDGAAVGESDAGAVSDADAAF